MEIYEFWWWLLIYSLNYLCLVYGDKINWKRLYFFVYKFIWNLNYNYYISYVVSYNIFGSVVVLIISKFMIDFINVC